MNINSED